MITEPSPGHIYGFCYNSQLVVVVDMTQERRTCIVKVRLRLDIVHVAALAKGAGSR